MTFTYKGVLCRLATYRTMGEDKPALYYIDAPDQKTMLEAGFTEIHYGLWAKILSEEEYEEIISRFESVGSFKEE
ncbi:MAG: hypothetical protein IIY65_06920 [Erysipelotrichaceae bacterium]|nr:hypothetical protein [Erysipelotrichaceae bacterium]